MNSPESDAATYDPSLDLASFDGDFAEAPVEEHSFDAIPDGRYLCRVERVELTHAQTSGKPMLRWVLRILGPQYQGRLLWRNSVITGGQCLKWLKTDLHTCGVDLEKLSDLPAHLHRLLDVQLEIVQRTKMESANIYFNRRVVDGEVGNDYQSAAQDALDAF